MKGRSSNWFLKIVTNPKSVPSKPLALLEHCAAFAAIWTITNAALSYREL